MTQFYGAFIVSDKWNSYLFMQVYLYCINRYRFAYRLGSRHITAASIRKETNAVAVVVSESSIIGVFDDGEIISEITPELWLLKKHGVMLKKPFKTKNVKQMTIVSKK